jgi:hypothetical protein
VRLAFALIALASCHHDSVSASRGEAVAFNKRVLALIDEYPERGYGGYVWPAASGTAGTTRDLRLGNDVIARGGPGNHCVGMTFELFWRALEGCDGGAASALDLAAAEQLKRTWYVPELGGRGAAEALIASRLGTAVALEDARPGDFVQAWNADGTFGHSMILLGADGDQIRYWSSQPWTDGIGRSESALGPTGFDPTRIYIARAMCR